MALGGVKKSQGEKMRNHIVLFSQISQPENTICVSSCRASCHSLQGLPAKQEPAVEKGKCRGCRKEKGIAGNEEEEWEV